jgi:hypothetical protein
MNPGEETLWAAFEDTNPGNAVMPGSDLNTRRFSVSLRNLSDWPKVP